MISISAFPRCWIEKISNGEMSLFEWIDMSVQLECEGLELYSRFLTSHEPAYLADVRRRIESLGMRVSMVCYAPDFTIPDAAARKKEVERQKEMIRVTAALGGGFCRTLSGQRRAGVSVPQGVDWVVGCIEACLPTAEAIGVKMAMENHYKDAFWEFPEFAQKSEVFLAILDRIPSPHLGVQFDASNALVAGDDPVELLKRVIRRVITCHASDRYLLPGTTIEEMRQADGTLGYPKNLHHGVIGRGMIDYDSVFRLFAAADFNGWVSIEDGMNGMEEMKESVDFLKRMRRKYWGAPK